MTRFHARIGFHWDLQRSNCNMRFWTISGIFPERNVLFAIGILERVDVDGYYGGPWEHFGGSERVVWHREHRPRETPNISPTPLFCSLWFFSCLRMGRIIRSQWPVGSTSVTVRNQKAIKTPDIAPSSDTNDWFEPPAGSTSSRSGKPRGGDPVVGDSRGWFSVSPTPETRCHWEL